MNPDGPEGWTASRRGLAILMAAAVAAGLAVAAIANVLPFPPADAVGPGNFHGVDLTRDRVLVGLVAVGWPVLTLALALGIRRLWRPGAGYWVGPALTLTSMARAPYDVAAGLTDAAILGLAAGLGAALALGFGAAGVAGVMLGVAAALALATGRDAEGLARAVAGLAPLGPALLAVASARTAVSVVETGAPQSYPWFSVWLAAALAVLGWVAVNRLGAERAARPVAMLWIGLPLAWVLTAELPGPLGPLDLLVEGETLVGAFAAIDGRWPWTELSMIHGPWVDVGRALVGMAVLDPTRWGAVAGQYLILGPMALAGNAALFAWLFGWRWPHAALATLVASGLCRWPDATLVLWAPTLAALALLLVRATAARAGLLVGLAAAQALLVPAALTVAAAVAVTVILHDAVAGEGRGGRRFRRSLLCGCFALPLTAAIALALVGTASGRLLWPLALGFDAAGPAVPGGTGGDAAVLDAPAVVVLVGAALAAIVAAVGWAGIARRPLDPRDWVVLAAALLAVCVLPGAVGGDAVVLPQAAVVPVGVVVVRLLATVEAAVPRPRALPHPIVLGGLLAAMAGTAVWPRGNAAADPETIARRLRPTVVVADGSRQLLGHAGADVIDPAVLDGWRLLLEGWVAPGGRVLDLSARPGLFHLLLGYRPTGRFLHGGLASRGADQDELAADLDRLKPEAVILPTGRDADGIPATVRLHRLSRAVLERYVPVEAFPDGVLYVLRGTELADPALHARTVACDWGLAAGSLALERPVTGPTDWPARPVSGPETVTFRGRLAGTADGVTVDLVAALLDGRPIADEPPAGVGAADDRFRITVQVPRGAGQRVRLAAALANGELRPIAAGPDVAFEGDAGPGGTPAGIAEVREIIVHDGVWQLSPLPMEEPARAALRLAFTGAEPGRRYRLGARPPWSENEAVGTIDFAAVAGSRTVVPVGACPQWWGFGDGPLYLWSEDGRPVTAPAVAWETGPGTAARP